MVTSASSIRILAAIGFAEDLVGQCLDAACFNHLIYNTDPASTNTIIKWRKLPSAEEINTEFAQAGLFQVGDS